MMVGCNLCTFLIWPKGGTNVLFKNYLPYVEIWHHYFAHFLFSIPLRRDLALVCRVSLMRVFLEFLDILDATIS